MDDDFGEFGTISYSIHSDYLKQKFHIDKNTGRVTTNTRLDREEQKYYEIPIMATDGGGKSSFIILRVKVLDENDNVPQFDFKEYKASIYSNLTIGMVFLKVCPKKFPAPKLIVSFYRFVLKMRMKETLNRSSTRSTKPKTLGYWNYLRSTQKLADCFYSKQEYLGVSQKFLQS